MNFSLNQSTQNNPLGQSYDMTGMGVGQDKGSLTQPKTDGLPPTTAYNKTNNNNNNANSNNTFSFGNFGGTNNFASNTTGGNNTGFTINFGNNNSSGTGTGFNFGMGSSAGGIGTGSFGTQQQQEQSKKPVSDQTLIGLLSENDLKRIQCIVRKRIYEQQIRRRIDCKSTTELKTQMRDLSTEANNLKKECKTMEKAIEEMKLKSKQTWNVVMNEQHGYGGNGISFLFDKYQTCARQLIELINNIDRTYQSCIEANDNIDISEIQTVFETNIVSLRYLSCVIEGLKNHLNGLSARYNIQEKKMQESN